MARTRARARVSFIRRPNSTLSIRMEQEQCSLVRNVLCPLLKVHCSSWKYVSRIVRRFTAS